MGIIAIANTRRTPCSVLQCDAACCSVFKCVSVKITMGIIAIANTQGTPGSVLLCVAV